MSTVTTLLDSPQSIGSWKLVPHDSNITFKAKSMWGLAPVNGRFTEFDGDGQITGSQTVFGKIVVKAASVDTNIGARDKHLRSADFFEAERYPDITVVVGGLDGFGGDTVDLRTDLKVKTTTAPLPLRASVVVLEDGALRVSAQAKLDRRQFQVNGNLIGMMGNKVTVSAALVFRRIAE